MLSYETSKEHPGSFLSLTGLKMEEFELLLSYFQPLSQGYFQRYSLAGVLRKHPRYEPRSNEKLPKDADKLFFLMVYLKSNPLQQFQACAFGITQGKVSRLVQLLTDLLEEALEQMGLMPCRQPQVLQQVLSGHADRRFY